MRLQFVQKKCRLCEMGFWKILCDNIRLQGPARIKSIRREDEKEYEQSDDKSDCLRLETVCRET